MPTFTTEQQLQKLTPEELAELKQALMQSLAEEQPQEGGLGGGKVALNAAVGFGQGALAGLRGTAPTGVAAGNLPSGSKPDQFETLLKREQLKNVVDPSRIKATRDLESEVLQQRRLKEKLGEQVDAEQPTDQAPKRKIIERDDKGKLVEKDNPEFKEFQKQEKEIVKIKNKTEEVISEIEIVEGDIEDLLGVFNQIPENLRGPIEGRLKAGVAKFFQTEKGGEPIKEYEDQKQFFLTNIARKLGGERGVLTDTDIKRVEGLFPEVIDKTSLANSKMDRMQRFITRRIDEHLEKLENQISTIRGSRSNIMKTDSGVEFTFEKVE